jgi:hypothetical protein
MRPLSETEFLILYVLILLEFVHLLRADTVT